MNKLKLLLVLLVLCFSFVGNTQETEAQLKVKAEKSYVEKDFLTATESYLKLLALQPRDPFYNLRYGVCVLNNSTDKQIAVKHLEFAVANLSSDPEAHYFLGKAYQLNYRFTDALRSFEKCKSMVDVRKFPFPVEFSIKECKDGVGLLSSFNELIVFQKIATDKNAFFRQYSLDNVGGDIVVAANYQTKEDKKNKHTPIMYFPAKPKFVFYASYGQVESNGLDLCIRQRKPDGTWMDAVQLPSQINTARNENYPYFDSKTGYLYFASEGHNSMGGYDLFRCKYDPTTNEAGTVENLDFPISSPDDDFLFIPDTLGEYAYFSSSRQAQNGKIHIYKVKIKNNPNRYFAIQGKVKGNVDAVRSIELVDPVSRKSLGTYEPDVSGNYTIILPKNGKYELRIQTESSKEPFISKIDIPNQPTFKPFIQTITQSEYNGVEDVQVENRFSEDPNEIQRLYAEVIRKQATLEPTNEFYSTETGEALLAIQDQLKKLDLEDLSPQEIKDKLIELVSKDQEKLHDIQTNQQKIWQEVSKNAGEILKIQAEVQLLSSKATTENDPKVKKEYLEEAAQKIDEINSKRAKSNHLIAYADSLSTIASETKVKMNATAAVHQSVSELPAEVTSEQIITVIKDHEQKLIEIHQEGSANATVQLTNQLLEKKKQLSSIQPQRTEYNQSIKQIKAEIADLEGKLNVAKPKDKEAIERQIASKRNEWTIVNQELARLDSKAEAISNEIRQLENRLNEEQAIQRLALSGAAVSSEQAKGKLAETQNPNFNTLQNYISNELATLKESEPTTEIKELVSERNSWNQKRDEVQADKQLSNAEKKIKTYELEQEWADLIQSKIDEATNNPAFSDDQRFALRAEQAESDKRLNELENWAEKNQVNLVETSPEIAENESFESQKSAVLATEKPISIESWKNQAADLTDAERIEESKKYVQLADSQLAKLDELLQKQPTNTELQTCKQNWTKWKEEISEISSTTKPTNSIDPVAEKKNQLLAKQVPIKNLEPVNGVNQFETREKLEEQKNAWLEEANVEINELNTLIQETPKDKGLVSKKKEWETFKKEVEQIEWKEGSSENVVNNQPVSTEKSDRITALEEKKKQLEAKTQSKETFSESEALTQKIKEKQAFSVEIDKALVVVQKEIEKQASNTVLVQEKEQILALKEANDAELAEVKQMQLNQLKTEIEPNQLLVKIDKTYQSDVQKTAPNQVDALIQREQALQTKLSAKISSNEKITAKSDKPELQAESEVLAELLEASKEREAQIQQQKQKRIENIDEPGNQLVETNESNEDNRVVTGPETAPKSLTKEVELAELREKRDESAPSERKAIEKQIQVKQREVNEEKVKLLQDQVAENQVLFDQKRKLLGSITVENPEFLTEKQRLIEKQQNIQDQQVALLKNKNSATAFVEWEKLRTEQEKWVEEVNEFERKILVETLAAEKQVDPITWKSETVLRQESRQLSEQKNQIQAEISNLKTELEIAPKKELVAIQKAIEEKENQLYSIENKQETIQKEQENRKKASNQVVDKASINQEVTFQQEQELATSEKYKTYFSIYQRNKTAENSVNSTRKQLETKRVQLDSIIQSSLSTKEDQRLLLLQKTEEIALLEQKLKSELVVWGKTEEELSAIHSGEVDKLEMMMMQNLVLRGVDPIAPLFVAASMVALPTDGFALVENPTETTKRIEIPLEAEVPSGLVYRVQVGAFSKPIPEERFNEFTPVSGEKLPSGITRYMAGFFTNRKSVLDAQKTIRGIGYSDAFPVAYCDGKRISMDEARRLELAGLCLPKGVDELMIELKENTAKALLDDTTKRVMLKRDELSYNQSPGTAKAETAEAKQGLFFTVQIGVYNKPVSAETVKNITPLVTKRLANGQIRYSSGVFASIEDAKPKRNEAVNKGVKDAFITAYFRGERITLAEAQQILAEKGNSVIDVTAVKSNKTNENPSNEQVKNTTDYASTSNPKDAVSFNEMMLEPLQQAEKAVYFISKNTFEKYPLELLRRVNQKGFFYYDETAKHVYSMVYKNEDYIPEVYFYRNEIDTIYIEDRQTQFHLHQFKVEGIFAANQFEGDFMDWFIRLAVKREIWKAEDGYHVRFEIPSNDLMEWYRVRLERFGFSVKVYPYLLESEESKN